MNLIFRKEQLSGLHGILNVKNYKELFPDNKGFQMPFRSHRMEFSFNFEYRINFNQNLIWRNFSKSGYRLQDLFFSRFYDTKKIIKCASYH